VSFPTSWAPDGTLFLSQNSNEMDLVTLARGATTTRPFAVGPRVQVQGEMSPDGRFVAYYSNESGRQEVYVRPSSGGAKQLASTSGGADPHWSRDGKQLYFAVPDTVFQIDVLSVIDGRIQLSVPRPVFTRQMRRAASSFSNPFPTSTYAVAANGDRFLYVIQADDQDRHPMTIVLNWQALLNQ
jgi:eukaryotic-like serine/threonine-protein kinase